MLHDFLLRKWIMVLWSPSSPWLQNSGSSHVEVEGQVAYFDYCYDRYNAFMISEVFLNPDSVDNTVEG